MINKNNINIYFFILIALGIYSGKIFYFANFNLQIIILIFLTTFLLLSIFISKLKYIYFIFFIGFTLFFTHNTAYFSQNKYKIIGKIIANKSVSAFGTVTALQKKLFTSSFFLTTDSLCQKDLKTSQKTTFEGKLKLQVFIQNNYKFEVGDKISLTGKLKPYKCPNNKYEQNGYDWSFNKKIYGSIINPKINTVKTIPFSYQKWFYNLRENLSGKFKNRLSYESANFSNALILGDKSLLEKEISHKFNWAGALHLLSISGLHIGFILLIMIALQKLLNLNYNIFIYSTILFLIFYAYLTGGSVSVIRAVIMCSFLLLSYPLKRKINGIDITISTGILMLFYNPNFLFSKGFVLSFLAVFSILLISKRLLKLFELFANYKTLHKYILIPLVLPIAVSLGTFPTVMYMFGRFNFISIISNILLIPLTFISFLFGLIVLAINKIPILSDFVIDITNFIYMVIYYIIDISATCQNFVLNYHIDISVSLMLFIGILIFLFHSNKNIRLILLFLLLIIFSYKTISFHDNPYMYIFSSTKTFASILKIENKVILIADKLDKNSLKNIIKPYLEHKNIKNIDYLLITSKKQIDILEFSDFIKKYNLKGIIVDNLHQYSYNFLISDKINLISLKDIDSSVKAKKSAKNYTTIPVLKIGSFSLEYFKNKILITNNSTHKKVIIGKQAESNCTFFNIDKGGIKIDFNKKEMKLSQYKFSIF